MTYLLDRFQRPWSWETPVSYIDGSDLGEFKRTELLETNGSSSPNNAEQTKGLVSTGDILEWPVLVVDKMTFDLKKPTDVKSLVYYVSALDSKSETKKALLLLFSSIKNKNSFSSRDELDLYYSISQLLPTK